MAGEGTGRAHEPSQQSLRIKRTLLGLRAQAQTVFLKCESWRQDIHIPGRMTWVMILGSGALKNSEPHTEKVLPFFSS